MTAWLRLSKQGSKTIIEHDVAVRQQIVEPKTRISPAGKGPAQMQRTLCLAKGWGAAGNAPGMAGCRRMVG